jgi:hypothetical protein
MSADFASVVRWSGDVAVQHRIESTVPGRHRATGRPPTESHPAGEGHRDEHMRTFFAQVAHVLPVDDDLLLIGDGEVVEHFAEQVRADDASHGRTRRIDVEKGSLPTERQLLARTRAFAGSPAKRRLPR